MHDELVGQEPDPLGPVFRRIRCPVEDPHGLLEEAFGLGEGVVPARLAMGEFQGGEGLGIVAAAGVVVGQDLDPLVEPVGVEVFDGLPGGGVVGLAPGPHECLVDGFLGEDVLEGVLALRRQGALVDEVEVFELEQGPFELVPLQPRHRAEEREVEDPAQHRGDLEQVAELGLEPVGPGQEQPLDGGGQVDLVGLAG